MTKFKLVIGDKSGKTKQIEVDESNSKVFLNLRVGSVVKGESVDMPGYVFEITGGSDNAGFPMRKDIPISGRRKVLMTKGIGLKKNPDMARMRRTVAGGVIGAHIAQINVKVTKSGEKELFSAEDLAKMAEKKEKPAKKE